MHTPSNRAAVIYRVESAPDQARWLRAEEFLPQWAARARMASDLVPAYARVLDLGCGAMDLERYLPEGCEYLPVDLAARDKRTIVCDFNAGEFPKIGADIVSMLGVLEYISEPLSLLKRIRSLNVPLVCSYYITDRTPTLDRRAQGWINDLSFEGLRAVMKEAGFDLKHRVKVDNCQDLYKWCPQTQAATHKPAKRVLVLSYFNDPNFGDRLGYHLINEVLPPHAIVTHASVKPWTVPAESFDMLVLGIGNSLNAATVRRPELHALMDRIPVRVGIFGTQYRTQYTQAIPPRLMASLLDRLTVWYARYEEDILAFARGRVEAYHLGDWLISAFPMAIPTLDRTLDIPPQLKGMDLPLDRVIQRIQKYKRVSTARIHPMLCALTSALEVKYQEQHEQAGQASGKFRAQLMDIFGRTFAEDRFFEVDRDAVRKYRTRVIQNMGQMRMRLADLLE